MTTGVTTFQTDPIDRTKSTMYSHRSWNGGDMPKGWRKNKLPLVDHSYRLYASRFTQSKSEVYNFSNGSYMGEAFIYFPQASGFSLYPPSDANLELKALSKLAEKVRGSDFNLAVSLAELPETLRMVAGSISNICNALVACKRGDWASVTRNLSRTVSGRRAMRNPRTKKKYDECLDRHDIDGCWNALTYGWKPALQDVEEGMNAFAAVTEPQNTLSYRSSARVARTGTVFTTYNDYLLTQDAMWKLKYFVTLKEKLSVARKLQLPAVASVAWELLPYSFVLDWFAPVASYLSTYSTFEGFEDPVFNSVLIAQIHTYNSGQAAVTEASWPAGKPVGGGYNGVDFLYERNIATSGTVPRPHLNTWSRIFSKKHAENAAALISARIGVTRERLASQAY